MHNSWHKLFFPRIAILIKAKMTNTECAAIEINYVHNNNNNNNFFFEKILLTTMLTVRILFTNNPLEKKKKLFIQNTINNSCRFKKVLI